MVALAAGRPGNPGGPREARVRTRRDKEGSRCVDED